MRFYIVYGELVKIIKIDLGIMLMDVVVIKNGDLIYIDFGNLIVNIVINIQRNVVIRFKEWIFFFICCLLLGDFMVVMDNFDEE